MIDNLKLTYDIEAPPYWKKNKNSIQNTKRKNPTLYCGVYSRKQAFQCVKH